MSDGAPDDLVVLAATWGLRAVLGYLGAVGVALAFVALPATRRPARRVLINLTPRVLRPAVAVALGATLIAASPPAFAGGQPTPPAADLDLDWPVGTDTQDQRGQPAPVVAPPPAAVVVVQPGDSLWRIAARRLAPRAPTAAIAAAWPQWWAANRSTIGPDPDLIRPGERLQPPAPTSRRSP